MWREWPSHAKWIQVRSSFRRLRVAERRKATSCCEFQCSACAAFEAENRECQLAVCRPPYRFCSPAQNAFRQFGYLAYYTPGSAGNEVRDADIPRPL
jgi:hypothetical protein